MKKYNIIYADPPWRFTGLGSKGIRSGAMRKDKPGLHRTLRLEEKYPTLSVEELKQLPVRDLADDNCVLFLWTTDAHLPYAIEVMRAWGFEYATVAFVWNKKEKSGKRVCYYGYWTMKGTELCLLGRKGKVKPLRHNIRQLVEAIRYNHSKKPAEVRNRIVQLMGDLPRIELFARQKVEGWDAWGNEIEPDIKLGGQTVSGKLAEVLVEKKETTVLSKHPEHVNAKPHQPILFEGRTVYGEESPTETD